MKGLLKAILRHPGIQFIISLFAGAVILVIFLSVYFNNAKNTFASDLPSNWLPYAVVAMIIVFINMVTINPIARELSIKKYSNFKSHSLLILSSLYFGILLALCSLPFGTFDPASTTFIMWIMAVPEYWVWKSFRSLDAEI